MTYVHYDTDAFYHDTQLMTDLAREGDADAVLGLYDRLYDEFLYIDALSVLAMLRHDADIYDEYWFDEYTYINNTWAETNDALMLACSEVLDTSCADAFAAHVGEDAAWQFRTYIAVTDEELDAEDRELELLDEYYALYDTIEEIGFTYEGRTWTLYDLYSFRGDTLYNRDPDAYYDVYDGLQQQINAAFAPLYIELVELWQQEARSAGYDSYTDYAYENIYVRDYTAEDTQRFCDAVKPIAREYYSDLYYSDMYYASDAVRPSLDGEALISLLGDYLPRIDDSLLIPWTAMTERGLYDVSEAASGRYDGAYTTNLLLWHSPFLYATLDGSCYDLTTITHEFGHFCDYWLNPQTNVFTQVDNLDLSEIHSNALQALFTAFYGDIYSKNAEVAEFINLTDLLENIIDGCIYDEFQRRIFAVADELTPERINEIHLQVCQDYGMYYEGDYLWDSGWVYISHNFERPLYYFSYAASAMAALQVWDMAQTDFDAAVDVYLDVLSRGSYDAGYLQVMDETGLMRFTEDGAAQAVCRPVLDRLESLDRAYR